MSAVPAIAAATAADWQTFCALARQEGWRVPQSELAFHRQAGSSRVLALRRNGTTIGFVTGVLHAQSAWIGNLIIAPEERRKGFGVALFERIVDELREAGAQTLWLTASVQGAPLYAARGFEAVGRIERWVRASGGAGAGCIPSPGACGAQVDAAVWGGGRAPLLQHLEGAGTWLHFGKSVALLQHGADLQIIGPWYGSVKPGDDAALLDALIAAARPQPELVVDLLGGSGREALLAAAGFRLAGETGLMACGPVAVQWPKLLALATLGSCG